VVYTAEQIEWEVSQVGGTWVKHRNLRNKLTGASNKIINDRINKLKKEVRTLKAAGIKEQALSPVYAKITQLELRLL
tara:strand:- start:251 stop:481 length:231 start_codon:yes stop_codon:yes gene_type:complete